MNADCRALLRMAWDLVLKENALLQEMVPTTQDVAQTLLEGRKPTPEQAAAWSKVNSQVTQGMN